MAAGVRESLVGGDTLTIAIDVDGLSSAIPGAHELSGEWDRVLVTAADRPNTDTLPAASRSGGGP